MWSSDFIFHRTRVHDLTVLFGTFIDVIHLIQVFKVEDRLGFTEIRNHVKTTQKIIVVGTTLKNVAGLDVSVAYSPFVH